MALQILERVLALEKEAEAMVERAHAEARDIEKETAEKIAVMRREAEERANMRISEYRAKAEAELKKLWPKPNPPTSVNWNRLRQFLNRRSARWPDRSWPRSVRERDGPWP